MAQGSMGRCWRQAAALVRSFQLSNKSPLLRVGETNALLDSGHAAFGRCFTTASSTSRDRLFENTAGTSYASDQILRIVKGLNSLHWNGASMGGGMGLLSRHSFRSSSVSLAAEKGERQVEVASKATSPPDVNPAGSAEGSRLRQIRGGPVSWLSLALAIATGAGILAYYEHEKSKLMKTVKQGPSVGRAAIGGPFVLLDHEGKPFSHEALRGQWNLLYFGFTNCPDICPAELTKMAQAVDMLEKDYSLLVRPVFITVDPERDGVKEVKSYVKDYHPRLIGLTGTPEEIQQVAKAYRVYYMKTDDEGDNYLVDHSIIMYLMDPNMDFVKFFGKNHTAESLAKGISEEVKEKGFDVGKASTVVADAKQGEVEDSAKSA